MIDSCYVGDVRDGLKAMIADGIRAQTCVTSPPYWRQRDYGIAGQLGLELTPELYIAALADVFDLVRDVLLDDGTVFVNLGDKWSSGGNGGGGSFMHNRVDAWAHARNAKGWRSPPPGYKDKDLIGLPFMLAFELRRRGWFWRQCNIWAKANGMTESISDRSTVAHEYVLHFSKRNSYFYNADGARTPAAPSSVTRLAQNIDAQKGSERANGGTKTNGTMKAVSRKAGAADGAIVAGAAPGIDSRKHTGAETANLRSVWWMATALSGDGHYAVMPDGIAEICIVSGSRPGDIVIDPFMGSGTVAKVAQSLGRHWLGCELNPDYVAMQGKRAAQLGMVLA